MRPRIGCPITYFRLCRSPPAGTHDERVDGRGEHCAEDAVRRTELLRRTLLQRRAGAADRLLGCAGVEAVVAGIGAALTPADRVI